MLSAHERQEPQETSALNRLSEAPLVFIAGTGVPRIDYFCLAGNKPPEKIGILIINVIKVL